MTYQQRHALIAVNLRVLVFRDFQNFPKKYLIIQSINTIMNIKSTQNTQENVLKYSIIEFLIIHAI